MSKKVFIDTAHGGTDPGAVGNGIRECDISLSVSLRVKQHLLRHGLAAMLSRETDKTVSLNERTNMANRWGADAFVSIHCNSATNIAAYGIETFCYKFRYRELADKVQGKLLEDKSLYYINRGVKEGDFHVIRESNMAACLVEMAFISNSRDAELLKTKQEEYAVAITKGILAYFGIAWKTEGSSTPELTTPPSKGKVDVYCKVDNYPFVKNTQDFAGVYGVNCTTVTAYPSKGEVLCRVSSVNGDYYPWVQNYYSPNGYYDFAGIGGVAIDRLQMKLRGLDVYSIKYRVHLKGGDWLPYVYDDGDYAGIRGRIIDAVECEIV